VVTIATQKVIIFYGDGEIIPFHEDDYHRTIQDNVEFLWKQ